MNEFIESLQKTIDKHAIDTRFLGRNSTPAMLKLI